MSETISADTIIGDYSVVAKIGEGADCGSELDGGVEEMTIAAKARRNTADMSHELQLAALAECAFGVRTRTHATN